MSERVFEPYPGAFDHILGPEQPAPEPIDTPESITRLADEMADCGFEDIEDALRRYVALLHAEQVPA